MTQKSDSIFLGLKSNYYGFVMIKWVVTLFSLSFLLPYATYNFEKWRVTNSSINGIKLVFKGKLLGAYYIYFIWFLIYLIFASISNYILFYLDLLFPHELTFWLVNGMVLFINSFFLNVQYRLWVRRSMAFSDSIAPTYIVSNPRKTIIINVKSWLIKILTIYLASPIAHKIKMDYFARQTKISGKNLVFNGTDKQLFENWWKNLALIFITLGLYLPILHFEIYSWRVQGLSIID